MHKALPIFLGLTVYFFINTASHACSVCFGNPEAPESKGVAAGVILLLAVTGFTLSAIAWTAFTWTRRARKLTQAS